MEFIWCICWSMWDSPQWRQFWGCPSPPPLFCQKATYHFQILKMYHLGSVFENFPLKSDFAPPPLNRNWRHWSLVFLYFPANVQQCKNSYNKRLYLQRQNKIHKLTIKWKQLAIYHASKREYHFALIGVKVWLTSLDGQDAQLQNSQSQSVFWIFISTYIITRRIFWHLSIKYISFFF